ncbi:MAG: cysteine--tRNA ligase [Clostridium sp.]|uniref:cysteine--tRNA ligase n=1 Tax=Clostridium sp. TaxID=1506 RepID=UPI0025C65E32|nr:cysteine--tRNA ligase [Clostridium sp.]MCH3963819.1 cysteine--tRNA ligase [Clostridium sp.]MCI1716938.1 cysteine--tRNA ligase [Clostridium sp.]MCI1801343.1 cysteine--tRNA ligase [Clostridium sp.]MCI1815189.1 cysteine--tRNA ligase [Clostridium sp.]MCI1872027.1 cysteine--tRNA ligase [Clostridium sp.]
MDFYIYNTMTRKKEKFIPVEEGKVRLYTCGPTVYNYAHIGNLRTYIFEDILKKSLNYFGFKVKHVMNITDVGHLESDMDTGEDKMQLGAKRENKTVWEIARFYENAFFEDCKKLNIKKPDVICRATDHIGDMINMIKILEKKGYTYLSNGNVYYSIDKFKDYNKLANLSTEELEAGRRVEVDENKKNPLDFVLWFTNSKFKNQIMQWDSPWGRGFPGWHMECSTMSMKYLGDRIDIHCGGVDHIPVHHTNEIAQSEGVLGHKWVNYWMHGEFLVLNSGKMSKSKGDFLTVSSIERKGFSGMDYRYLCLQSRYRKQLLFSFDALKDAHNAYKKLKDRVSYIITLSYNDTSKIRENVILNYKEKFSRQIGDDLNIPNAITVLYDVIKSDGLSNNEKKILIDSFDSVLSLELLNSDEMSCKKNIDTVDKNKVEALIMERDEARSSKNWNRADEIRDMLNSLGVEIIDSKQGSKWKIK